MRQPPALRRGPFAFVVALLALVSCAPPDEPATPAGPTEVRHDLAPLTTRFPALGAPTSASWVTWNSSSTDGSAAGARPDDRSIPGPTTYWIQAVVHLAPSTTARLVTLHRPLGGGAGPDVQQLLRSALPTGPFLTSAGLDGAFTTPAVVSRAFLDPNANALVLSATSM